MPIFFPCSFSVADNNPFNRLRISSRLLLHPHTLQIPFQPIGPERRARGSASRTMAAMSLGFIVMATPWTIQEVVAACTGSKVPPFLDFLVTWTAISNSFWNPFLYWLLNAHFRRISRELLTQSSVSTAAITTNPHRQQVFFCSCVLNDNILKLFIRLHTCG